MDRYGDRRARRGREPGRTWEEPYDRGWSYGDQGYTRGDEFDWDMIGQDDADTLDWGRERSTGSPRRDERRSSVSQQTFEYGWGGDGYGTGAGEHAGRGPRGYQRSDARIADDVCDRLTRHGWIDASDIEVRVEDGEVTLEGTVDSRPTKRLAEEVAESVSGVRDVHNRLRVAEMPVTSETSS